MKKNNKTSQITEAPIEAMQTQRDQLEAALLTFDSAVEGLGVKFAVITFAPGLQEEGKTMLHYAGNVSITKGEEMLETFLEIRRNPKAEERYRRTFTPESLAGAGLLPLLN